MLHDESMACIELNHPSSAHNFTSENHNDVRLGQDPRKAGMLSLPVEVRFEIFKYYFTGFEIELRNFRQNGIHLKYNGFDGILQWDQTQCGRKMTQIFLVCKRISREASKIFWEEMVFVMMPKPGLHLWADASRPKLQRLPDLHNSCQRFAHKITRLHFVLCCRTANASGPRAWLRARMRLRMKCILFDELVSLRYLRISVQSTERHEDYSSTESDPTIRGVSDCVFWLIEAIPKKVEIQWDVLPGTARPNVTREDLKKMEEKYGAWRSTASSVREENRSPRPAAPEPVFEATAREQRRHKRRSRASVWQWSYTLE